MARSGGPSGLLGDLRARLLPRYEWREIRDPGSVSLVIYDKWTGRLQRAVWDDKGGLNVMGVYTPF